MSLWTKNELISALKNQIIELNIHDNLQIDEVIIDSRKKIENALFIAIKGDNNNGHDYLDQSYANGAKIAIVQESPLQNQQYILVKDTFKALWDLAKFSRSRSDAKIIALTGSVGKTTTKEMLKSAFSTQGKSFATHGNLNNHFGVPLSLCNFERDCDYGIFEMGMNHAGEIEPLSKLVKPDLAIITNVGPVHIEFFDNIEGIAKEKLEILSGLKENGISLINQDILQDFKSIIAARYSPKIFGKNPENNYQITNFEVKAPNNSIVSAKLNNNTEISYEISTSNTIIIENSIIITACLDLIGKNLNKGLESFKNFELQPGRGQIIEKNGLTIIDDSYNASTLSIKAGIKNTLNLKNSLNKPRIVTIIGDMLELGEKSVELHKEIVDYIEKSPIDFAIFVGNNFNEIANKLPQNSYKFYPNSILAAQEIDDLVKDGDILYIKGSRGMKMEEIIKKLTNSA